MESFEHLTVDLLNTTPPMDGIEPKQEDLSDDIPRANPSNDVRSSDLARDTQRN